MSVFATQQTHNGGFRADQLTLAFGGTDVRGFLVQNVQFSYSQQISLLYEIGSEFVYYVGGRAQGNATLGRIIGPSAAAGGLITLFSDLCDPRDISFNTTAGCSAGGGSGGSINYDLKSAVLTTIAVSVTAQDVVVNEQLQFMFLDLESG